MSGLTYIPLVHGATNFTINADNTIAVHDENSGKVLYVQGRKGTAIPTGVYVRDDKIVRVEYQGE